MRLALFPYDIVHFPGLPLPLRFFEPRYKQMCDEVVPGSRIFGVVLARPESTFENEVPADVGTVVRIEESARLPDGQWLVRTVGTRRFRIRDLGPRDPYLTADVELLEESPGNELRAYGVRDSVAARLRRLFAIRTELGTDSLDVTIELSPRPGPASYEVAALMGATNDVKQRLLETPADDDRLAAEVVLLDEAIAALEQRLVGG